MAHLNLVAAVADLERHGRLVRVTHPVDPNLEMAEVQRRLYAAGGPAVLFTNPKNTAFPMLANLFGTLDRCRFLFRDTLDDIRKLVELKIQPDAAMKKPWKYWKLPYLLWRMKPRFGRRGPILDNICNISQLPKLKSWPMDGGSFVTLPQVYTEHPDTPGWQKSNLGMYRVQLDGNEFTDAEIGMHYQIHRGIGIHHSAARKRGEPLKVNVIVGGPPALAVSAVMPLPESLSELLFAAILGGRRLTMVPSANGLTMPAEADFVISGTVDPTATKPEGPFGDHLGYYSLQHPFPVMKVERVYHRRGAIWPFTVVGRPPQEDTTFGQFIHELTGPVIPNVLPGVKEVHAVDASGVHPLLLAIGSERYVPWEERRQPQELLTQANAILGQGQLSLAKYLWIASRNDNAELNAHDIPAFFRHMLERVDWSRDLHFYTKTTIDTLDYSAGEGLNAGSKVVIAAVGPKRRELGTSVPSINLPDEFKSFRVVMPGVLAISGPKHNDKNHLAERDEYTQEYEASLVKLCQHLFAASGASQLESYPLITLVDSPSPPGPLSPKGEGEMNLRNWLWLTFTRSNPATDILGVDAFSHRKHFGCRGPLVIDARFKAHMAPPLVEDPAVSRRVDELAMRGGPLHGLI